MQGGQREGNNLVLRLQQAIPAKFPQRPPVPIDLIKWPIGIDTHPSHEFGVGWLNRVQLKELVKHFGFLDCIILGR